MGLIRPHRWLLLVVLFAGTPSAFAAGPYLLVSGRWDNTVVVIDVQKAMDPANDGTANAIINRVRVTPDIDAKGAGVKDTPASGQPVNVVLSPDGRFAYIVNHSGVATPAAADKFQHGHAGTVTVLDVAKALDPANNMTLNAVDAIIATKNFGPVGLAATADGSHALVSGSEGDGDEDGGRVITVIDLAKRDVLRHLELAYGKPGFDCPPAPIPHAGPHMSFGCFTDTNAVAISPLHGGVAFTANGGTNDVSVVDVRRALAGDPASEIARIPVASGPWGLAVSPDGKLVASAIARTREPASRATRCRSSMSTRRSHTRRMPKSRACWSERTTPPSRRGPSVSRSRRMARRCSSATSARTTSRSSTSRRRLPANRAPSSRDSRSPRRAERRRDRAASCSRRTASTLPSPALREVLRAAACCGSSTWRHAKP